MTHWHEPLPGPGWQRCCQCGKPTEMLPSKVRGATCNETRCNLEEDRLERCRVMTPVEYEAYRRAAEAYFNRPADDGSGRPLTAPRGLAKLSSREAERLAFDRAAKDNDEQAAAAEAAREASNRSRF